MPNIVHIYLKGEKKPIVASNAFVDSEARIVEIPLDTGFKRKIPFESILYFDLKQS